MALKIDASDLVTRRSLSVDSGGLQFQETALGGGARRIAFSEVDCILLSTEGVLSVQVGREVFKLATKRGNAKHQQVIDALVQEVRAASLP